ncbi:hypothetical protein GPL15_07015 [Clostridium sp. MCC353]|uniref:hypothetical protein n=1 Tax=Clostridium sp. MCC353 TaxID=2592646 RepID=UPI001C00D149|nr:hypothetical protein [Clostridium sp. MCC353]MBT9776251.1 hypothetical protein [Clostridium sp. MCC353]
MLKKINVNSLLFYYILFMALLLNYVEKVKIWQFAFAALIFMVFVGSYRFRSIFISNSREIIILLVLICLSMFCSEHNEFAFMNFRGVITPSIACLSLFTIMKSNRSRFEKMLMSCVKIINAWWVLNIIALLIQISGYPIFLKQKWIDASPYYKDLCCGLFGQNRTHELVLFSCMIYSCNLKVCELLNEKNRRKGARLLLIYTIVSELLMLVISTQNDNTAMFLFLPWSILLRGIIKDYDKAIGVFKKSLKYIVVVILAIVAIRLSLFIPSIREVFEDYLYRRLYDMLNYNKVGVAGSNERLAIVEYALSLRESYLFGQGFGMEMFGEHIAHGFKHFGLSSIGSTIYIAGLWYYLMQIIIYCRMFVGKINQNRESNIVIRILIFVTIFSLSIYSPIFISFSSIIFLTLFFAYI